MICSSEQLRNITMIIQNSMHLLNEIGHIEEEIAKIEHYLELVGLNKDNEKYLEIILKTYCRE